MHLLRGVDAYSWGQSRPWPRTSSIVVVQGRAGCLVQRDGPESQSALPVIITKPCTVHFGSRPLWGVGWDLMCVCACVCMRHDPFHHQQATLVASPIRPLLKFRQHRAFDASPKRSEPGKELGSIRKLNICSSAASSLKISP